MARNGAPERLQVRGLEVLVERKRVKHIRLRVYPPGGEVRVSAPLRTPSAAIEAAVLDRLDWIEGHRRRYVGATPAAGLEYVSGEVHYLRGEPVTLRLEPRHAGFSVSLGIGGELVLRGPAHARLGERAAALERWQRAEATREAERLVALWEPRLGVEVAALGLKRMRSRWGTCNPTARRVWLNTELIKRPATCFEYVVVHELAHILVPDHSSRFWAVVGRHLPAYREARAELDRWPTWAHGRLP